LAPLTSQSSPGAAASFSAHSSSWVSSWRMAPLSWRFTASLTAGCISTLQAQCAMYSAALGSDPARLLS
jgi:hypothetical protein